MVPAVYIFFIILFIILIFVLRAESLDLQKIPNIPECSLINNYCLNSGNQIKYVIQTPPESAMPDILFNHIQTEACKNSQLISWRISLIATILILFGLFIFQKLSGINNYNLGTYTFLLVIIWFVVYWTHNYFNFHYYRVSCLKISQDINLLKNYYH